MTTECIDTRQPALSFHVGEGTRERIAAIVAAAGVVLLLPGASFLMGFLVSQGLA